MTLGRKVYQLVKERGPFNDRIEQVFSTEDDLRVRCEICEADRLGCAVTQLEIVREHPSQLSAAVLAERVERLCEKVTYLLEPLQTIEVDPRSKVILVRSRQPRQRDDELSYYELLAKEDWNLSLRRYTFEKSTRKRGPVPYVLTGDQLEMLLDDLAAPIRFN